MHLFQLQPLASHSILLEKYMYLPFPLQLLSQLISFFNPDVDTDSEDEDDDEDGD
jgi:hypothetical protein